MKTRILQQLLGLTALLLIISCSKNDTVPNNTNVIEGKWSGGYSFIGGPVHFFILNFKLGGAFSVDSSLTAANSLATGTWIPGADSARATYTYSDGSGTYSLAGKYSADFKNMNGTIGNGTNTAGAWVFSVTK